MQQESRQTVDSLDRFCRALHSQPDLKSAAAVFVTDAAALLQVDRIAVFEGSSPRLLAVTGLPTVDPRADEVVMLNRLALMPETDWTERLPLLEEHRLKTAASTPGWIHIHRVSETDNHIPLAIVCESFTDAAPEIPESVSESVFENGRIAFHNIQARTNHLWLYKVRQFFSSARSFKIALLATAILLALFLIPARFEITVRGRLFPVERQFVFAPTNGVITTAEIHNGKDVEAGANLISIHSPTLERERARLLGEKHTASARLTALQASRNNPDVSRPNASEAEVQAHIAGLNQQLQSIDSELATLDITTPFAGRVFYADAQQQLNKRPVEVGERLFEVAQIDGPWQIELRIPERVVRHVLFAQQKSANKQPLTVRYLFLSVPGGQYSGTLESVELATQLDEFQQLSTAAFVAVDASEIESPHPGMEVLARINCGSRSIGFVWFREVIEFVQSRLLF